MLFHNLLSDALKRGDYIKAKQPQPVGHVHMGGVCKVQNVLLYDSARKEGKQLQLTLIWSVGWWDKIDFVWFTTFVSWPFSLLHRHPESVTFGLSFLNLKRSACQTSLQTRCALLRLNKSACQTSLQTRCALLGLNKSVYETLLQTRCALIE